MSEMFEQELELEKKSSWGPLLLVLALLGCIVGGVIYYVLEMRKGLPPEEASAVVNSLLQQQGTRLDFHVGKVVSSVNEQAKDPHYKLLAQAGYLTIKNTGWNSILATVTPTGEQVLSAIPGFKKFKAPDDDTWTYEVPLASRKLVKIDSITMNGPSAAKVAYEWRWEPTKLGDLFDVDGKAIESFNTWDRGKLIEKYGADYYHAAPKKEIVRLQKSDKGWALASE